MNIIISYYYIVILLYYIIGIIYIYFFYEASQATNVQIPIVNFFCMINSLASKDACRILFWFKDLSVVSIQYESTKFVQIQKVGNFQLLFAALFLIKSAWNTILRVTAYLFAGARSKMMNGNHALALPKLLFFTIPH